MRYTVSGRAQSIITAGLAVLLAFGVHLSAASRSEAGIAALKAPPATSYSSNGDAAAPHSRRA